MTDFNVDTINKLFLELSQIATTETQKEYDLQQEILRLQGEAYQEQLDRIEANIDRFARAKTFIVGWLDMLGEEGIKKHFGTQGREIVKPFFDTNFEEEEG